MLRFFSLCISNYKDEKTEYLRKRTWKKTTRETVTSVKKETRTELEVFVQGHPCEVELFDDRLGIQVKSSTSFSKKMPTETLHYEGNVQHSDASFGREVKLLQTPSLAEKVNKIQQANEKICVKIEQALGGKDR